MSRSQNDPSSLVSASSQPNRRRFLSSTTGAVGIFGASALVLTDSRVLKSGQITHPNLKGWNPDHLSKSVLTSFNQSFVRLANNANNQKIVSSDLQSAAATQWALAKHLHEVGYHQAACTYIAQNTSRLANQDPVALEAHYNSVQKSTGLQVPFAQYSNLAHPSEAKLHALLKGVRKHKGIANVTRNVSRTLLHYSTLAPVAYGAPPVRSTRPVLHEEVQAASFRIVRVQADDEDELDQSVYDGGGEANGEAGGGDNNYIVDYFDGGGAATPAMPERWCWYLEWFGLYLSVMGLPLAAVPVVGTTLVIAGIVAEVVGLFFLC